MTRRLWVLGLGLVGCGCLLAGLSLAADEKKDAPKDSDQPAQAEPDPVGDAVANIALATKLEEYGRQSDDPKVGGLALANAATILRHITLFEGTARPTTEGGAGEARPEAYDKDALVKQSDQLFKDALKKSKNDEMVQKLVQRFQTPVTRGGLNGPMEYHMRLRRGQTDTYNLKFKRNAWVRVAIRQETDSPTNLYTEIRNGRGDVRSSDGGRSPVLGFMPHGEDGTDYIVKVKNNGPHDTYYYLFTN